MSTPDRDRNRPPNVPSWPEPIVLSARVFRRISDLVRESFGIHLAQGKQSLVVNRLHHYLLSQGMNSYEAFLDHVEADLTGEALDVLAGLISTNYTYFFREEDHFEFLKTQALPEVEMRLANTGDKDLRVWCAAASTGEEAYSIAMTMLDYFGPRYARLDAGILATDLSLKALRQAATASYTEEQVRCVPPSIRRRYFHQIDEGHWSVVPEVRAEVLFRKFNLTTTHYPFKKPFHIIFCRNVMIYFDPETRQRLVSALFQYTAPGGFLFIGHSETIAPGVGGYRMVRPAVYRRPEHGNATNS